ncbi:MAG: NHLP bacteriocin export ABC transporter permease/ATPase subunit [Magnetococcales bacterium]|nr:NHLP bacteriocin export ABC transporter permease/ATPase subunit [Magnetococcales bacterium]
MSDTPQQRPTLFDAPPPGSIHQSLAANRPLLLDDPHGLWLVRSGRVFLFLVAMDGSGDHAPPGRRRLLATVADGGLLPGLPIPERFHLLVTATPGSEVVKLPDRSALDNLPIPERMALIDGWIDTLSDALAELVAVPPEHRAVVGSRITLRHGERLQGRSRTPVWVVAESGGLGVLDREPESTDSEMPLPLTDRTWVVAAQESRVVCLAGSARRVADQVWPILDRFHTLVMATLIHCTLTEEQHAIDAMGHRHAMSDQAMHHAMTALAEVARPGSTTEALPDTTDAESLLRSLCHRAAEALGVEIPTAPSRPLARRSDLADTPKLDENRFHHAVTAILTEVGLRSRKVLLREGWHTRSGGVVIARRNDGTPVTLVPGERHPWRIHSADAPRSRPLTRADVRALEPDAVMLYPPLPDRIDGLGGMIRFALRGSRADGVRFMTMGAMVGGLALMVPVMTGILFGSVIPNADADQLLLLIMVLIASAISSSVFGLVESIALLRIETRASLVVQSALFDRLLRLPVTFFKRFTSGDLSERVMGIQAARRILTSMGVSALLGGIFSLFSLILMFHYSWRLALIALALVLVSALVIVLLGIGQLRHERKHAQHRGTVQGVVLQLINSAGKLQVAAAVPRAFAVWARLFAGQKQAQVAGQRYANGQEIFQSAYPVLATVILYYGAARSMALDGSETASLTAADFLAFNAAFGQLFAAITGIALATTRGLAAIPLIERAEPLLSATPERRPEQNDPGRLVGGISCCDLRFRYQPDAPWVLKGLSFAVRAGGFIALVGSSGSGKSTIMRLLAGFETPESGEILFDGKPLSTLNHEAVRRQIGVVLQQGEILAGSIYQNIAGVESLTLKQAWDAARQAGFDDDIRAMPMGMHTMILDGAASLSGGQRQRLMIARALARRPRILLLDEATSALDNLTQSHIAANLAALDVTRLVIAHRLSTIRHADRILVLDQGTIVESGNYDTLMAADGPFKRLAQRQLL